MNLVRRFRGFAVGFLGLGVVACPNILGPNGRESRELGDARERWAARGAANYEFVVRNHCFCVLGGVPVKVVVWNGSVQSATIVSTGAPVPTASLGTFRDIEGLFGVVRDAIHSDAARIDATYDPFYGFPVEVFIDYQSNIADEEFGWVIDSFVAK